MEDDDQAHINPTQLEARQSVWAAPVKTYSLFLTFVNDVEHRSHFASPLPLHMSWLISQGNVTVKNRTPTPIDAWSATTPAERLPYAAQIQEAIAEYKADIQAFNARIPLSPLVHFCLSLLTHRHREKKHTR